MAAAPVGDDQYGEDPTVNRLQERVAELLGKEAALFVPSGTMANQIGLKILTRPGDEVVVGDEAHIVWHESGAAAANSGVQFTVVGAGRTVHRRPICAPPTSRRATSSSRRRRLVAIENTHNRGGGVVFPQARGCRDLRGRAGARARQLSRRRPAVQCRGGHRAEPGRARRAFRRRLGCAVEGARLPGRQPCRRPP